MEQNNNSGSLFRNKKDKPSQPDYTGTAAVNGQQYRMSAWVNKSKAGNDYLRILFSEQQQIDLNPTAVQTTAPLVPSSSQERDLENDLPF